MEDEQKRRYWRINIKYLIILLSFWFLVSLGCSVLWVDYLDQFYLGPFKFGFWMAQQGSIYAFVLIIFIYVFLMNRLDKKFEKGEL